MREEDMNLMGLVFVVVVGIIGWWCWYYYYKDEKKSEGKLPKGNSCWPFIGETLHFIASGYSSKPLTFMDNRKSLYGKVFRTHILGKAIIVSTDSEVNKVVLQNHGGNSFVPSYPKSITQLLGDSSILQMEGSLHKRIHALIGTFFKSPILKSNITHYIQHSVKLSLASWIAHHHPKPNNMHNFVYVQDETKKITFEVLVRVLMSVGPGEDLEFLKREYAEFIKGLICLPIKFPGTRLYKSLKAKERLLKMVRRIIEERKMETTTTTTNEVKDAVDLLLRESESGDSDSSDAQIQKQQQQQHRRLPLDFISGNIIEMMIPGEDTVPMTMTLAVKFLSDCPVALTQLMEENMELKRKKDQACEDYAWTDYMSLPFTQNVISETLRMANIINAVWRKALKDVEIKGYLIPKGWCVMASFSSVHMDEDIYENPYKFDPWRWEKKKGGNVNNSSNSSSGSSSSSFTPFGGGQRLCPGLELSRLEVSIFLHHLVTTYRWVAEKDEIISFPTVKMKRKLPIRVTPISQSIGQQPPPSHWSTTHPSPSPSISV